MPDVPSRPSDDLHAVAAYRWPEGLVPLEITSQKGWSEGSAVRDVYVVVPDGTADATRSFERVRGVAWEIKEAFAAAGHEEFVDVFFPTRSEFDLRDEPVADEEEAVAA